MNKYRILVEYDGTDFIGWQFQNNGRSVQAVLETCLTDLFGTAIRIHGAGRTDTGVHARGQVAHFQAETLLDERKINNAMNARLPADVSIVSLDIAPEDFHARFSAASRIYIYRIHIGRTSLLRRDHWIYYGSLDHDRIREALQSVIGTHDFTTYSKYSEKAEHCYCHVYEASWELVGDIVQFRIKANRFLKGMVRCITGGLIQVGRGRLSVEDFRKLLEARNREFAPQLVPPHGLTLEEVGYDPADYAFMQSIITTIRATMNLGEHR